MNQGLTAEVFMILGAVCGLCGVLVQTYRRQKEPYKGRATATVVEIVADSPDARGSAAGVHDYFYPVFAYYAEGRLIKKRYQKGGNPCPFRLNQQVPLYYKKENPELIKIADPGPLKKAERILYAGGFCLCLAGLICYLEFAARFL
ncbi:MAG: hypothetical protein SOZ59_11310 [Candidatus Limivivens sp.]|nr:hypothetical protein [Candidatus Limivivens sp.]